jgi:hypothetical protein
LAKNSPLYEEAKTQKLWDEQKLAGIKTQIAGLEIMAKANEAKAEVFRVEVAKFEDKTKGLRELMDTQKASDEDLKDKAVAHIAREIADQLGKSEIILADITLLKAKYKLDEATLQGVQNEVDNQINASMLGQSIRNQIEAALTHICELQKACNESDPAVAITTALEKIFGTKKTPRCPANDNGKCSKSNNTMLDRYTNNELKKSLAHICELERARCGEAHAAL